MVADEGAEELEVGFFFAVSSIDAHFTVGVFHVGGCSSCAEIDPLGYGRISYKAVMNFVGVAKETRRTYFTADFAYLTNVAYFDI